MCACICLYFQVQLLVVCEVARGKKADGTDDHGKCMVEDEEGRRKGKRKKENFLEKKLLIAS